MEAVELSTSFAGAYAGRRVLVTGHTGFKGSWLVVWLQALGADVHGLALDPDTDPSHWSSSGLALAGDRRVDLRDAAAVRDAVAAAAPEVVFHLAAQPLVRRSYHDPVATFATNVMGLVHLFEALRVVGTARAMVNATTDKVYEPPAPAEGYAESHPLGGHDPYSASKACAEIASASWRRSYFAAPGNPSGPALATARAGNVIGGGDWAAERLVPDIVRALASGDPLVLRNPGATRPWQHVLEPLSGYLELGRRLLAGEPVDRAWNFGPADGDVLTVGEVVASLARHWNDVRIQSAKGVQPHEAPELRLDSRAARQDLGWAPVWSTDTAIARTAAWYRRFLDTGRVSTREDLAAYVADARLAGIGWAG